MTAAPFMAPLFAGLFFGPGFTESGAEHNPCGRFYVAGEPCHLRFRSYSGSLWKSPKVTKGLLPLTFGASLWLGMPSLRSCSVGPSPSAIHGRGRLTRHPCRVAHCAEPALGLTRGRTPQQRPRRPTGRPGCWGRSSVRYLVDWQAAIASRLAPTVGLGTFERNGLAGRPPSRASSLPQKSKGRAAHTTASLLTTHQAER
jgi:hypothetical protein